MGEVSGCPADSAGRSDLLSLVDEKMRSLVRGRPVVDAMREVVQENLMLKNDLFAARGMLSRVYAIMERLQSNPEFMAAAGLRTGVDSGSLAGKTEDTAT